MDRFDEEEFDDDSNSDLSDMSEVDDGDEDVDDEMGAMIHQFDTDMEEDEVRENWLVATIITNHDDDTMIGWQRR